MDALHGESPTLSSRGSCYGQPWRSTRQVHRASTGELALDQSGLFFPKGKFTGALGVARSKSLGCALCVWRCGRSAEGMKEALCSELAARK